jgi:ribosome-binding factor A
MTQRTDRIDQQLREEIGAILVREISDPRIGFATITDVETVPDLSHAKVWVSVIGQPAERKATLRALAHAMPYVRHQLGTRLHLRRIPELHVELDETAQRGTRLLKLLEELESGRMPDPSAPVAESLPTPVPRVHHDDSRDDVLGEAAAAHTLDAQARDASARKARARSAGASKRGRR